MKTIFKMTVLSASLMTALSIGACASNTTPAETATKLEAGHGQVVVTVTGIKQQKGKIMAALFNKKENFLGPNAVGGVRVPVTGNKVSFSFKDLPAGEYAITIFQDVDSNGEMAKNAFGIPTEPYGFSNDAPIRFGPPKWDAARFSVGEGKTTQTITLK